VSLGGWVRGAEAFAVLLSQNYSKPDAALLRQPALFDHFEKQLAGLSGDVATDAVVAKMRAGLRKGREVVAADTEISPKEVKEISGIAHGLLKNLNR
jgi:uncharacterized protein YdbL (DUF1318 family)